MITKWLAALVFVLTCLSAGTAAAETWKVKSGEKVTLVPSVPPDTKPPTKPGQHGKAEIVKTATGAELVYTAESTDKPVKDEVVYTVAGQPATTVSIEIEPAPPQAVIFGADVYQQAAKAVFTLAPACSSFSEYSSLNCRFIAVRKVG